MRAPKRIQHLKADADGMSERLFEKIRKSDKCSELLLRVPAEEHKRYALDVYCDVVGWLETDADPSIEHRYVALGKLRAQQDVPFSNLLWAVCITREYLWNTFNKNACLKNRFNFGEE